MEGGSRSSLLLPWALLAGAARAQSCDVQVEATQALALATITLTSPCHRDAGEAVRVSYGDDVFLAHFDASGRASLAFVLFKPHDNRIRVRLAEGQSVTRTLDVPEFASIYRLTLVWQAPANLRLHVVEPGRRLGEAGDVSADQPRGLGRLDLAQRAPEQAEGSAEQSYVLPDAARDRRGVFSPYLENASLGDVARAPFCGEGPLGSIPFRLVTIADGEAVDAAFQTARLRCGEPVQQRQRRIR